MNLLHGTWLGNRCWCSSSGKIGTSSFDKMSSYDKTIIISDVEDRYSLIKMSSNINKKAKQVTKKKRRNYDKNIIIDEPNLDANIVDNT